MWKERIINMLKDFLFGLFAGTVAGCVLVLLRMDGITKFECDHYSRLFLENVEYVCVRVSK